MAEIFFRAGAVMLFFVVQAGFAQPGEVDSQSYLDRLEWRGVMALPGAVEFSFYDPAAERSFWIRAGQIRNGIEVVRYEVGRGAVTIRRGDAERSLVLNEGRVKELDEGEVPVAPAPLVKFGGGEILKEEKEVGEISGEAGALWAEVVGKSAQLREIEQQFFKVNQDEENLRRELAEVDPADPAYRNLQEQAAVIAGQRRFLTEGAISEIGKVRGFSRESGELLRESFRAGFSHQLVLEPPAGREAGGLPD